MSSVYHFLAFHSNNALNGNNRYYYPYKRDSMNNTISSQTMVENRKTMSIGVDTWERIKELGKFGESYDDLFNRIMDELEECRKERKPKK